MSFILIFSAIIPYSDYIYVAKLIIIVGMCEGTVIVFDEKKDF